MSPSERAFWETVDAIRDRDPRFRREAYAFLLMALAATAERMPEARKADPERRHLTGQELLAGLIVLARQEFGVMAPTVFREWGVTRSLDVGEMVFQLVEAGQLSARPEDRREDFDGGPDLLEALAAPTRPRPARGPES
jgi:uncharacterized repeat protein (TIGR04138 family)